MSNYNRLILQIDHVLSAVVPDRFRVPIHHFTQRNSGACDPMIRRLPSLLRGGTALDIGANQGLYSYEMARHVAHVVAFEPQPIHARRLAAYARHFRQPITVHQLGLSDRESTIELRVPFVNVGLGKTYLTGLASMEVDFEQFDSFVVDVQRLDDFDLSDVTFVKIDVEGHESRVLDGATQTIARHRPRMLIEIEQRHLGSTPIAEVFGHLSAIGYDGGFYLGGHPTALSDFRTALHQPLDLVSGAGAILKEEYVNNFVFWPRESEPPGDFSRR